MSETTTFPTTADTPPQAAHAPFDRRALAREFGVAREALDAAIAPLQDMQQAQTAAQNQNEQNKINADKRVVADALGKAQEALHEAEEMLRQVISSGAGPDAISRCEADVTKLRSAVQAMQMGGAPAAIAAMLAQVQQMEAAVASDETAVEGGSTTEAAIAAHIEREEEKREEEKSHDIVVRMAPVPAPHPKHPVVTVGGVIPGGGAARVTHTDVVHIVVKAMGLQPLAHEVKKALQTVGGAVVHGIARSVDVTIHHDAENIHSGATAASLFVASMMGDKHAQEVMHVAAQRRMGQTEHKKITFMKKMGALADGVTHLDANKAEIAIAQLFIGAVRNLAGDETNKEIDKILPELEQQYGQYKIRDAKGQEHYLWGLDQGHMRHDELREILEKNGERVMVDNNGHLNVKDLEAKMERVIAKMHAYVPIDVHKATIDVIEHGKIKKETLADAAKYLQANGVKVDQNNDHLCDVGEIKAAVEKYNKEHPVQDVKHTPTQAQKLPNHKPARHAAALAPAHS